MTITPEDLVRREVFYCVSSLVSTLASGSVDSHFAADFAELIEQAFELACPIDDYEEAAIEAGWSHEVSRMAGTPSFVHPDHGRHLMFDDWRELCEEFDIEPYQRDVFEHWIVSGWLADKLEAKGEKVDRDFAGLTVWARTTTGQAISIDYVIEQICAELNSRVD